MEVLFQLWCSSITFPEKEVIIQYRLTPESSWQTIAGSEINFSKIDAGTYTWMCAQRKMVLMPGAI